MSLVADAPRALHLRTHCQPESPVFALRLFVPGGARSEGKAGLAAVAGRALGEATQRLDRHRLLRRLERRGIALGSSASFDGHGLAVDAPAAYWQEALELALEVMLEPAFDPERLAWVLAHCRQDLLASVDEPGVPTASRFVNRLYAPRRQAYSLLGDPRTIELIDQTDVTAFHRNRFDRECIIAAAGCFDLSRLEEMIERRLGPTGGGVPEPVAVRAFPDLDLAWMPAEQARQAHFHLGRLTVPLASPDRTPLALAAVALGAGPGLQGRIPLRVREQEGLAYLVEVATVAGASVEPGCLEIHVATSRRHLEAVEIAVREELQRALEEGFSHQEIEAARRLLVGAAPFRRETPSQWADLLVGDVYYGVTLSDPDAARERIGRATLEDVQRVAARYLDPAAAVMVS